MEEKFLEFTFERDAEYKRIHATGFWGGLNLQGELEFDVVEDVTVYPSSLKQHFALEDGLVRTVEQELTPDFTTRREFIKISKVGIVIPSNIIPSLIEWLQEQLKQLEQPLKMAE